MELINKVSEKSPKEQLLELFENQEEPLIVMMSNEWFNEFTKCKGVEQDYYELNRPDYYAYFIHEDENICSKLLMKIEVKFIEGLVIIIDDISGRRLRYNRQAAEKIYYFHN